MAISQGTVLDNVALAWSTVNPSAGDLFILFFYNDGGDNQGGGPGLITRFDTDVGTSMEAGAYWHECAGSESSDVFTTENDFNNMGNEGYNAHWFLVPAAEWHGTTPPEHAKANSATGTVDPPSLSPSGWDASAEDTIWIIAGGRDDDDGISAVSSDYTANQQLTENVNQVEVGSSHRTLATATEDPGAYTHTGTAEEWVAYTIAVRPAGAAVHTLVVQDAWNPHTVENVDLVQTYALDVAAAWNPHVADEVTIATGIALVVQDAWNPHLADEVSLTEVHDLVAQSAWNPHVADNATLTTQQFLSPDSDVTVNWTDQDGLTTDIYLSIDEVLPVDSDYIQSPAGPSASVYECMLEAGSAPTGDSDHVLKYRYKKDEPGSTINLQVQLFQSSDVIVTWTHNDITTDFVTQAQTISDSDIANITDYADLRVRLTANP